MNDLASELVKISNTYFEPGGSKYIGMDLGVLNVLGDVGWHQISQHFGGHDQDQHCQLGAIRHHVADQPAQRVGAVGGLGAHVLTFASDTGLTDNGLKVRTMRLPDMFQDQDDPMKQYDEAGLNAPQIVDTVLAALRHNSAGVEEARA